MINFREDTTKTKSIRKAGRKRARRLPFQERVKRFFVNLANGLITVLALALIGFIGWRIYVFMISSSYFKLTGFEIKGVNEELKAELETASGISLDDNRNILLISASALRSNLLANSKIRDVRVKKIYPNRIEVTVEERKPIAILNCERMYLVDGEGYVTERLREITPEYASFLFISGIEQKYIVLGRQIQDVSLYRALDLMACLRENNAEMFSKISEINLDETRNLTLYLSSGTEILCGRGTPVEVLPDLEAFMNKIDSIDSVEYVDLRIDNQAVYKTR